MTQGTTIPHGCFVVLDLPDRIGAEVLRIRERFRDPLQTRLPVEITVAGSSGNGVVSPGQSSADVFTILGEIAATTAPIIASFGRVKRFSNTDIFVLTLRDTTPFRELHRRIDRSGIRFEPMPYPFEPHCTLSRRTPISDDDVQALLVTMVSGRFTLDTLAVYQADPLPATLLHRVSLSGYDLHPEN